MKTTPSHTPEPASFRDPEARVVYSPEGEVLRELSPRAQEDWAALESARFFRRALDDGRVVATEEIAPGLLRHERVPFVSYPYEWPFEMLREAALLQLGLLDEALAEGFVLKDASPYNVQWRGSEPVFVDVGSFEHLRDGEPWAGYRQFCTLFLYPLMLQAYRGIAPQPWLRGSLEGIEPAEAKALLPRFRRGVLTHVVLHDRLEAKHADRAKDVRAELKASGFRKELIQANVRRLRKLVGRLSPRRGRSTWAGYREAAPYTDEDAERKERFVREAGTRAWPGTSARTTGASRAPSMRRPWSRWTGTSGSSASCTRRCGAKARARSCRSSSISPIPPRGSAGAASSARGSSSAAGRTSSSASRSSTTWRSGATFRSRSSSTGCAGSTRGS